MIKTQDIAPCRKTATLTLYAGSETLTIEVQGVDTADVHRQINKQLDSLEQQIAMVREVTMPKECTDGFCPINK